MSTAENRSLFVVLPGNILQHDGSKYDGNTDNNILECHDSRKMAAHMKSGIVQRLDLYLADLGDQALQIQQQVKAEQERSEQRIAAAKKQLTSLEGKKVALADLLAPQEPVFADEKVGDDEPSDDQPGDDEGNAPLD